ncbi:MAG TPA: PilZ domain-containing protein [Nitrospirae bacterium]|nr:PilZ domain protein [bacterium BMS3Abin10]GBE38657.1 PilZ domain protein [bacterium BMS3Bbin08]HDH50322.1 PilZ domain-containing protein [Nitrospirota bacterium]HDK16453.1 PilZ domain-containing protein [Nitrospirota bacterium]HDO25152.1 PilZ domain-containing protein [Nitrospirota bacterium]
MGERAFKRIPANIEVIFFSGTQEYYGTVTNLSEKGMFINTEVNFPLQQRLKVLMPWQADTLWLHARVRSFGTSGNIYNGIGVELVSPSLRYLEFIGDLRTDKRF